MESIQEGKQELVNTRKKIYGKLVDQQPIFNLRKKNVKKAMKPVENIKDISKDIKLSSDFINNLTKDLKSLDPSSEGKSSNPLEWIFSLVGLLLVLVSPFIPESVYISILGDQYCSAGTYLVLLSLSLIFLTSFFRHKYTEQVLELQKIQYTIMFNQFEKMKFQMQFGMKDLNAAFEESSEEFGEVLELLAASFEKFIEEKEGKK